MIQKVAEYKEVLTHEVNLVVQYLLSAPEPPVCLYGIMLDKDSLPHFFLAVYPYTQEPRDAEDYVQTCDKLKTYRLAHVNNCKFMAQLFETLQKDINKERVSAEGHDSIKAIYEQWSKHQKIS